MIRIDLDLMYLSDNYGVSAQNIIDMSGFNSISEIMEEESANGNTDALNFKYNVFNDPDKLIKAFRLKDALNRYLILNSLNANDLMLFLERMKSEDLAVALKFFQKDKLLLLLATLPPDRVFEILKQLFSVEEILALLPEDELNHFFLSHELEDEDIMKYLELLPPEALAQFFAALINEQSNTSTSQGASGEQQSANSFRKALLSIDPKYKSELILLMLKDNQENVKAFSSIGLVSVLDFVPKAQIAGAVGQALEPQEILKLIDQLPHDLLAMVATQLDVQQFSKILINNFQAVLSEISL